MAKDTFYFLHDYNARNDPKILELRSEFGLEGYGIYWCLVETMAEDENGYVMASLMGGLSVGYGIPKARLMQIVKFMLEIGLLHEDEAGIYSPRLLEYKKFRKLLSDKGKEGAQVRWKNSPPNSPPNANKRKGKERKIKKENDIKEKSADFSIREPEIKIDFRTEGFKKLWKQWTEYKIAEFNDKYKTIQSEQIAFNQFYKLAGGNEKMAGEIITQSISNRWKGLFALKNIDKPVKFVMPH